MKKITTLHIKREIYIITFALTFAFILTLWNATRTVAKPTMQTSLANEILRFHIRANSDSDADQNLKLKIKDKIVEYMNTLLVDSQCIEQTKSIINQNMDAINEYAKQIMNDLGYNYPIKTYIGKEVFPVKTYGDICLPSGEYEALIIEIGEAEGKNWWCIMFPPLCFIDATTGVVPEESKQQLQSVLTDEEYESIVLNPENAKVKVKFKLFDIFK